MNPEREEDGVKTSGIGYKRASMKLGEPQRTDNITVFKFGTLRLPEICDDDDDLQTFDIGLVWFVCVSVWPNGRGVLL